MVGRKEMIMRALFLVMLLCTLAWAQKGAALAVPIDTTIVVKDISKAVTGDTKFEKEYQIQATKL